MWLPQVSAKPSQVSEISISPDDIILSRFSQYPTLITPS
jgi:hypothetical protein